MLRLELLSAATFGRGDGVAGLVDREVEQDQDGFPFLRGRTLKGLLAESAEDVVFAFEQQGERRWSDIKSELFGKPGSGLSRRGTLHVGEARLPEGLRRLLLAELRNGALKRDDISERDQILVALTGIRRQTAMNHYGAPDRDSLRSMRVIVRGCIFEAELIIDNQSNDTSDESRTDLYWTLLAGAALGLRRGGTGRNRGRGWLKASLIDETTTRKYFEKLINRR
jgi:hypothetical protein